MAGITPILVPCLVGALVGMVFGYFAARLITSGRRWTPSSYQGRCERCGNRVLSIDQVSHSPQRQKVRCPACTYG